MARVRWGILSTAKIAVEKVIPAMQGKPHCDVVAIASRDAAKAKAAAERLGIQQSFGSYESLLADDGIDAIFNPLPNHLHLEWSIRALEAGKHVLCEKPLTLNADEARTLVETAARFPKVKIMEAFMYRFHLQWQHTRQLVMEGAIGEVRTIQSFFSYYNTNPDNIRNIPETGGGALLDIGCYCISLSRFVIGREPERVLGIMELDPKMKTDRLISGVLDFGGPTGTFTCSTQLMPYQRVHIVGTTGRIEVEIPFNAPLDVPCRLWIHSAKGTEEKVFPVCNQYEEQGKLFSLAVLEDKPVPTPLDDALNNMKVIDSFRASASGNTWVSI